MFEALRSNLWNALSIVFDPSSRVFWGSLLGSIAFILVLSGARRREHLRILFSPNIWLHPSSRADVKIIVINLTLQTTIFSLSVLSSTALAAGISLLLTRIFGQKLYLPFPPGWAIGCFSLALFIVDDFARFYLHWLQHRWRWLWVFHQTHHSALVLTPLTLFRTHPIDMLGARFRNTIVYGTVTGLGFFVFGKPVSAWEIMGVEAFGFIFNFSGANLRHSQVWLHFGWFDKFVISPAAHQIHHSQNQIHYNKNFGVCLAFWDRLWSTHWIPNQETEVLSFGLKDSKLSDAKQSLWILYWQPFVDLFAPRQVSKME